MGRLSLKPIHKAPKAKRIGAFDVEGDAERFVVGVAKGPSGEWGVFTDPRSLVAFMKSFPNTIWFAHNAIYDVGVLLPHIADFEIHTYHGRLLKAIYPPKKPRVTIADSFWFFPMPLSKIGQALGLEKLERPWESEGEIVDWNRTLERVPLEEVMKYCKRDVEIVWRAMRLFQEEVNRLGGELKLTLASTTLDVFRRAFLDCEYETPSKVVNNYCREAYYGGRVENLIEGEIDNVFFYDVNSMYPYIMKTLEFPDPNTLRGPLRPGREENIWKYEGVTACEIEVPFSMLPPLPYRVNGKVIYPYGRLRGAWTHLELREALKEGARIIRMEWQIIAEATCNPFRGFVETLYALRKEYKQKGDPRELVVKIMMNSLYGKFGENADKKDYKVLVDLDHYPDAGNMPEGSELLSDEPPLFCLMPRKPERPSGHWIVIWAAYITAGARVHLRRLALQAGEVFYMDTDSLVTRAVLPNGSGLGELKLEKEADRMIIRGPKLYTAYKDEQLVKAASRGVPVRLAEAFIQFGKVVFARPLKLLEAFRRKLLPSQWILQSKESQSSFAKRKPGRRIGSYVQLLPWRVAPNGRVR